MKKIKALFVSSQHTFTTEDAQKLEAAKNIHQKINQRKLAEAKQKLNAFFKSYPNERDVNIINLETDNAWSTFNANSEEGKAKLANISLPDFHNDVLRSRIQSNELRLQYIFLADLDNAFKDTSKDDITLALRQLASISNTRMVKECLERGGDPLQAGKESGINAIGRARENGHEELAVFIENFKPKNTLQNTLNI